MSKNYHELLEIERISVTSKRSHLQIKLNDKHMNRYKYVHGGVYFSLADSAAGAILASEYETWVTLNSSFNFIAGCKLGTLNAYATLVSKTRKTCVIDVSVKDSQDTLCAVGTFTMYHIN